jgi:pimeloyl-ACP methyl ester carboxylesterase
MNKVVKILLRVIFSIFSIFLAFLLLSTIINSTLTSFEKTKFKAPGKLVKIDNGYNHIFTEGKSGKNIILLTGAGTPSPIYDFKPLSNQLKRNFIVTTVEPFGYGWSSTTNKVRSSENIIAELRELLIKANINPPYILVAHSISGIFALYYANKYPEEINGILCLDTTVPEIAKYIGVDTSSNVFSFFRATGLVRIGLSIFPNYFGYNTSEYSPFDRKMLNMTENWNIGNICISNELLLRKTNCEQLINISFPSNFPTIMILSKDTIKQTPFDWERMHRNILGTNPNSKIFIFNGGHYIHHDNTEKISSIIDEYFHLN